MTDNKKPIHFELCWAWYDSFQYHTYIHLNKTETEFKEDVQLLLKKYGKDYIDNQRGYVGASSWIDFISDKMYELGYEKITPIRESFFGAYIIEGTDEDDIHFGDIVGQELLHEAIEHNNNVREQMEKRLRK